MRYMIIHSSEPFLDMSGKTPAHCFGPFENWEKADESHHANPDDCYVVAIPIVGPQLVDVNNSNAEMPRTRKP